MTAVVRAMPASLPCQLALPGFGVPALDQCRGCKRYRPAVAWWHHRQGGRQVLRIEARRCSGDYSMLAVCASCLVRTVGEVNNARDGFVSRAVVRLVTGGAS